VHMTLWSLLAAPLLAGNDLREMSPAIAAILMNREVIAIDQDQQGKQGRRVSKTGDQEIWTRPLSGGDLTVALFNRGTEATEMAVKWSDLGLSSAPSRVRDLWSHAELKPGGQEYKVTVPSHGVVLLRLGK
jgi:alpha-galactosidase